MDDSDAIYRITNNKRSIALTFDIGWGKKVPGPVLRVLRQKNVNRATFFLSATWVAKYPGLARRIHSAGYEIGSHGYLHEDFTKHSDHWIRAQVKKAERIIRNVTGVRTRLIRTPNGSINGKVVKKLRTLGYRKIHWSVDSLDWTNPGNDAIVKRVLSRTRSGDIILMHASDSATQTAKALPKMIDGLRAKGFRFVTVSELINGRSGSSRVP
ncbi:polysaccharide deacetylase family sporulation protein PdaB [Paenibacillus mesophilus]|uniref:polysaccharide deacetylase family sporulation protein PdaB n=1 Tax=Paenibacillus mesophilus TaxID=2582849 RepID=UPI0013051EFB|nr:polysaccharide deacetylase family sporulation protein PdaB [Paenibacillus mesophilus]